MEKDLLLDWYGKKFTLNLSKHNPSYSFDEYWLAYLQKMRGFFISHQTFNQATKSQLIKFRILLVVCFLHYV